VNYLNVLAASAWVERRQNGTLTNETKEELRSFEDWGAAGLKRVLSAQGFLD